jgi:hypothetical protein
MKNGKNRILEFGTLLAFQLSFYLRNHKTCRNIPWRSQYNKLKEICHMKIRWKTRGSQEPVITHLVFWDKNVTESLTKCQIPKFYFSHFSSNYNTILCKLLNLMSYIWVNTESWLFLFLEKKLKGTYIQKFWIFWRY